MDILCLFSNRLWKAFLKTFQVTNTTFTIHLIRQAFVYEASTDQDTLPLRYN